MLVGAYTAYKLLPKVQKPDRLSISLEDLAEGWRRPEWPNTDNMELRQRMGLIVRRHIRANV